MTTFAQQRERIMHILTQGGIIRRVDGRWQDSFVDINALDCLIAEGLAEVYDNGGMKFVRLPQK